MWSIRSLVCVLGTALSTATLLPPPALAQQAIGTVSTSQTDVMNARRIVLEGDRELVENGPQRWALIASGRISKNFTEAKRTETSIYLSPVSGGTPLLVDLAAKKTYMDFKKVSQWAAPVAIYPTSGYSVSRIEMLLDGKGPMALDLNGTDNVGWKFTTYEFTRLNWDKTFDWESITEIDSGVMPESSVSRTTQQIAVKVGNEALTIHTEANTCTITGHTCTVARVYPISALEVGQIKYGTLTNNNQWVGLSSLTQVSATTWREETASGPLDWTEERRDARRLTLMKPDKSGALIFNMSTGAPVRDSAGNATAFRIAHVQRQWPGQLGTVFQPVSPSVSPGFQIQNKTDYPVLVTLEQVGCLYYGIVKPGEIFQRNTGAVWFTIKASMAPDLKEPTVESCIRKPALYAATIVVAGVTAAGTGGTATGLVVPAMLAAAAGQGAAITTEQYALSNTGSAAKALGARVGVTTLASGTTVIGLAIVRSAGSPMVATSTLAMEMFKSAGLSTFAGLPNLYTRYAQQSDIDSITGQLTQETSVFGAYAGYPWPWPMADRVMPRYDITGGPRIKTLADGTTIVLKQEQALTITKVN